MAIRVQNYVKKYFNINDPRREGSEDYLTIILSSN